MTVSLVNVEVKVPLCTSGSWFYNLKQIFHFIRAKQKRITIPQFPESQALLLAGGVSKRWRESIPPMTEAKHKSCAAVGEKVASPIQRAVINLVRHGISKIHVVIPSASESELENEDIEVRDQIRDYLRTFNNGQPPCWKPVDGKLSINESVSEGLKKVKTEAHTIVAYSDIIWPDSMIEKLMAHETGEIVVLVDKDWEYNYPASRTWHNKLNAELVFSHKGEFTDAGELTRSYPMINRFPDYFKPLLNIDICPGEVVGLFKFSKSGRDKFIKFCSEQKGNTEIPLPNFTDYRVNIPSSLESLPEETYNVVLFATFLAYFAKKCDVKIEMEFVEGIRWFEIDWWQDAERVRKLLPYWDPTSGEMRPGAPIA